MTQMGRSRIIIEWPNGGPGVITFHWVSGDIPVDLDETMVEAFHDELDAMIAGFVGVLPSDVSMIVGQSVDVVDVATGNLLGILDDPTTRTGVSGTGSASGTSRATQFCVNLLTNDFTGGKRLRGRHFWGPLASNAIVSGGSISSSLTTGIQETYDPIIAGPAPLLVVWHRPTPGSPSSGRYGLVKTVTGKANPAILRSRRD